MIQMVRTIRRDSPGYGLLLSSQFVSLLGDNAARMALAWVVLDLTGSTLAMGRITALTILPTVLLLPFTGWISDNLPRLTIMAITDLVRALAVGVAAWLAFRHALDFHALQIMVVVLGAGSAFFMPASQAARAELLTPASRVAGNVVGATLQQLPTLIGPLFGASLLALGGSAVALGLDAGSYLVSLAGLLLLAQVIRNQNRLGQSQALRSHDQEREPFLRQLLQGLRFVLGSPWLAMTIAIFSIINVFLIGFTTVLLPWLIKEHLHLGVGSLALVVTATGSGAILGGLIIGRLGQLRRRAWWAYGAVACSGLATLLIPVAPFSMILLLAVASGICSAAFGIIWETSLQELVPRELFGRVVSLDMLGSIGLAPIGVLVVGWMAQVNGELGTMVALGALTLISAGIALCFKGVRAYD